MLRTHSLAGRLALPAAFAFTLVTACGRDVSPSPASSPAPASAGASAAAADSNVTVAIADTAAMAAGAHAAAAAARDSGEAKGSRPSGSSGSSVVIPHVEGRTAHDTVSLRSAILAGRRSDGWPAKGPAPLPGAILPAKRIVAFYGNPLSKRMGVLGEYPVDEMLSRLDQEVARWQRADPSTPVQPALHLIAVVAQGAPGRDGMYRLRMDSALIEKVYGWAQSRHALLFLDIQVGKSTVQAELPHLLRFLARPDVHLGLDPEFSMHYDREGLKPGAKIGIMDAAEVNYAIRTLSDLVAKNHLPPKVLVVHRFTRRMLRNAEDIRLDPRVQVVIDMDGWGPPWLKFDSYRDYEVAEPVQYTGFKLFFHNDVKKGDPLITPAELLALVPRPLYIQYQ